LFCRNDKYLDFIRKQSCIICGKKSDAHHIETGGMGIKASDYRTIPLCRTHHTEFHNIGRTAFEERYLLKLDKIVIEFLEKFIEGGIEEEKDRIIVAFRVDEYSTDILANISQTLRYINLPIELLWYGESASQYYSEFKNLKIVTDTGIVRDGNLSFIFDVIQYDYFVHLNNFFPNEEKWLERAIGVIKNIRKYGIEFVDMDSGFGQNCVYIKEHDCSFVVPEWLVNINGFVNLILYPIKKQGE